MKFIQLKPGVLVRKSDIVAIEQLEDGGCRVLTLNTSYECPFYYESLMPLLETEDIEETISVQKQDRINLWGNQHWAG